MNTTLKTLAGIGLVAAGGFALLAASQTLARNDARDDARGDDRGSRPARTCVQSPLEDTRIIDESTLLVTDYHGNAAILKMSGRCMQKNEAIGIKYYGVNEICGRTDVDITGSVATAVPIPCFIDSVTQLSKDEAKAYLSAH